MVLVVVATEAERPHGEFEIVVSGVGKTAAAVVTAERLATGPPVPAVVSFGVAGAYPGTALAVGDVVVATEISIVDEGLDAGSRFVPFSRPGMEVPGAAWVRPMRRSSVGSSSIVRGGSPSGRGAWRPSALRRHGSTGGRACATGRSRGVDGRSGGRVRRRATRHPVCRSAGNLESVRTTRWRAVQSGGSDPQRSECA